MSRRRSPQTAAVVAVILLAAFAARAFYAHGLPLNWDETRHLQAAKEISLRGDSFHLPFDSPLTNHPLGAVYVTAIANWVGGGSIYSVRLAFIGLSLFGLLGLYLLGNELFGPRVALFALALAAVDRHLVAAAPVFLESPCVIFLAPWVMLLMHRCLARGAATDWLTAGAVFGLGYSFSTVFLAMLPAFALYILLTGRVRQVLTSPWMYAGAAILLAIVSPSVIADRWSDWSNLDRNINKVGSLGFSPRVALLYVGDVLMCFKSPTWIVHSAGDQMYSPVYIPCHWVVGVGYIALMTASLCFVRDQRVLLPLAVLAGFLAPATLLNSREPWNEFTWASSTVFSAAILACVLVEKYWANKFGRVLAVLGLVYATTALLGFLVGPKWGYFCPEWERAYIGRVLATAYQPPENLSPAEVNRAIGEIRELTDETLSEHPDSAMAWYFRGFYTSSLAARDEAFQRSLELEPNNPPVFKAQADDAVRGGHWELARELLLRLLENSPDDIQIRLSLGWVEHKLGKDAAAFDQASRALNLKPESSDDYRDLYLLFIDLNKPRAAERALQLYLAKHWSGPAEACLSLAGEFWKREEPAKSQEFLERAIAAKPRRAEQHVSIGRLLVAMGESNQAIDHLQTALQLGETNPDTFFQLAQLLEQNGHLEQAVAYYREAVRRTPGFAEAHHRLGVLLSRQRRTAEARLHFDAAKRLGFSPPSLKESD